MSTLKAIYACARTLGFDEDARRDFYQRETGKRSLAAMTADEQSKVLAAMHAAGARPKAKSTAKGALRLDGPYVGKCRALWISGWHLGVVQDRADTAMVAFIKRQTGIDHANWLRRHADATRVIEALKKWLAREAGVNWSAYPGSPMDCVLWAQCRLLGEPRPALAVNGTLSPELYRVALMAAIELMGERIRALPEAG